MNHRQYEEWLFADLEQPEDNLTNQDNAALQVHLQDCESCRQLAVSWKEVETQFRVAPIMAPVAGFTQRWQARLQVEHRRRERRQTLALLGFSIAGAVVLIGSLLIMALPMLRSPNVYFWTWLYQTLTLASLANAAGGVLRTMLQAVTGVVPLTVWVIFVGLLTQLAVIWVVSFRVLTKPRRILLR